MKQARDHSLRLWPNHMKQLVRIVKLPRPHVCHVSPPPKKNKKKLLWPYCHLGTIPTTFCTPSSTWENVGWYRLK